jgi:hypothetical protein
MPNDESDEPFIIPENPLQLDQGNSDEREVMVEELNLSNFEDEVEPEVAYESESVVEDDEGFRTTTEIMNAFEPLQLREVARVTDTHALRTSCFNADGDYFVLGTNSKSIKICSMHNIVDELLYNQH